MTALTAGRTRKTMTWGRMTFTLTGVKIFQGSELGLITKGASAGKVTKYTATQNLIYLGLPYLGGANGSIDATVSDKPVQIDLDKELTNLFWAPNGATPVVAATHNLQLCYFADDNSVVPGTADLGVSPAGYVLGVDSVKGVLVLPIPFEQRLARLTTPGAVGVFTANDWAPAQVTHGAMYLVPTTGAASTITLPDAAAIPDGLEAMWFADGTVNGHTVTFRDAGTANASIRAAYTASKRFLFTGKVVSGKWVDKYGAVGA